MKTKTLSFLLLLGILFTYSCQQSGNYAGQEDFSYYNTTEAESDIIEEPIQHNTEEYDIIRENEFLTAKENPLSTFSIDVDNASYSNVRRYLQHSLPPVDAVRIEEMINYFNYDYPQPEGPHPFSLVTEVSKAPWNPEHKLVHIGLQGKSLDYEDLRSSNLVFLIDCSGSMKEKNKLPLLKQSFEILLDQLGENDRVAIVAYASAAG